MPEKVSEVKKHPRIGVLVQGKRGRSVLERQMEETGRDTGDLRDLAGHLVGDPMESECFRRELDRLAEPHFS
jgi:hypothetical protein